MEKEPLLMINPFAKIEMQNAFFSIFYTQAINPLTVQGLIN